MESKLEIDKFGDKRWYNEKGQLHREDGPAIEWTDGSKSWWVNGQWHREDGPAIEYADGSKGWYINSQRHRVDGPAYEEISGYKEWRINLSISYVPIMDNA